MVCDCLEMDPISHSFECIATTVSAAADTVTLSGSYFLFDLSFWPCRFPAADFGLDPLDNWMIGERHCNCPGRLASQAHGCCIPAAGSDSWSLHSSSTSFALRLTMMNLLAYLPSIGLPHSQSSYYNVQSLSPLVSHLKSLLPLPSIIYSSSSSLLPFTNSIVLFY